MILRSALAAIVFAACGVVLASEGQSWEAKSPSGRLTLRIEHGDALLYSVRRGDKPVVQPSRINLKIGEIGQLVSATTKIVATQTRRNERVDFPVPRKCLSLDTAWQELTLDLGDQARVTFRVYDEGVAFRWETKFAGQIVVEDETAEFVFPSRTRSWFPEEESTFTHQERIYKRVALEDINPDRFCSTGVLMQLEGGEKIYVSESDLRSYPGMFLRGIGSDKSGLVGKFTKYPRKVEATSDRDYPVTETEDYLARTAGERTFPWRLMLITDDDKDLLTSELVYQLGQPCQIGDTSWIKPGKVSWDWWNGIDITGVDFRAGVNTETYLHFVDFAAEYGIEYVLLDEGWSATSTDVLHEHDAVDLPAIIEHANKRGVKIILWTLWNPLFAEMEPILDRFEKLGVAGIKVDFMQRDDQVMIEFYHRCASGAAKRHLLVDFHGACKPFGLNRTYPNVMTYEGVNGLEQYKWGDKRTTPDQELILPFTRMVAGPMDFTPGGMRNANPDSYRWVVDHPMVLGTRCHQLAMYVVYESPLQMLADSPTQYRKQPECMKFLSAVPTVWDETVPLEAKVGESVAIARRSGDAWFIGAMTNSQRRALELNLDFLPPGEFTLDVWQDGVNADRNAEDFSQKTSTVTQADKLAIGLAPAGGWVGWLRPFASEKR